LPERREELLSDIRLPVRRKRQSNVRLEEALRFLREVVDLGCPAELARSISVVTRHEAPVSADEQTELCRHMGLRAEQDELAAGPTAFGSWILGRQEVLKDLIPARSH
jgi:hypothetical protein